MTLLGLALNVSETWLMGYDVPKERTNNHGLEDFNYFNSKLLPPTTAEEVVTFPVIGEIAAGYDDQVALQDWSGDTVDIPLSMLRGRKHSDFFVLSVHGDSMDPLYLNGDRVLILKQSTLNHSGDVGAILYDNEISILKKLSTKKEKIG